MSDNIRINPFTGKKYAKTLIEKACVEYHSHALAFGIILKHNPTDDDYNPIRVYNVTRKKYMTEVKEYEDPDEGEFRVDYAKIRRFGTAFIEMNSANVRDQLTVTYRGIGKTASSKLLINEHRGFTYGNDPSNKTGYVRPLMLRFPAKSSHAGIVLYNVRTIVAVSRAVNASYVTTALEIMLDDDGDGFNFAETFTITASGSNTISDWTDIYRYTYNGYLFFACSEYDGVSHTPRFFRSTDDGGTWSELTMSLPGGTDLKVFSLAVGRFGANDRYGIVGYHTDGTVRSLYSTDGYSWTGANLTSSASITTIESNMYFFDSRFCFTTGLTIKGSYNCDGTWSTVFTGAGGFASSIGPLSFDYENGRLYFTAGISANYGLISGASIAGLAMYYTFFAYTQRTGVRGVNSFLNEVYTDPFFPSVYGDGSLYIDIYPDQNLLFDWTAGIPAKFEGGGTVGRIRSKIISTQWNVFFLDDKAGDSATAYGLTALI